MKKIIPFVSIILFLNFNVIAQDTTFQKINNLQSINLHNNLQFTKILQILKLDSSFYNAFKNLHYVGYSCYNNIEMLNPSNKIIASLNSKATQIFKNNCRFIIKEEEKTTGDMYNQRNQFNYETAKLYAHIFLPKDTICNEKIKTHYESKKTKNITSIDKRKEQLKTLFFNPGAKIKGIPFLGDKLNVYDSNAREYYDYSLDQVQFNNKLCFEFKMEAKKNLTNFQRSKIIIDNITTWLNVQNFEIVGREYALSYNALFYDFNVQVYVEMTNYKNKLVPNLMRYKGNWKLLFNKREKANFTATLFNFKEY